MIIHLKDTAIQLNPSEVRAAKKLISRFITSVSSASKRTGQISFLLYGPDYYAYDVSTTFGNIRPKRFTGNHEKVPKIMLHGF